MNAYSFFLHLHSGFRYVVFLLVLLAIASAWVRWLGKQPYSEDQPKIEPICSDLNAYALLYGLILYFLSPLVQFGSQTMKQPDTRYWTVEHLTAMIIAIILVTIGHSKSKKIQHWEANINLLPFTIRPHF